MPLFGDLFDFDRDGELSDFERAAELGFLAQLMAEEEPDQDADD